MSLRVSMKRAKETLQQRQDRLERNRRRTAERRDYINNNKNANLQN